MADIKEDDVMAALGGVADPARDTDVVSAGMISGLALREGHVVFSIAVDPDEAKAKEPLRIACEEAVDKLPGVLSVTAVLTAHRPQPQAQPAAGTGTSRLDIPGIRTILAVASGKGGVGKSTTAVNLALAFLESGLRVGLMDADIYGPSIPRMMGIDGRPNSPDNKRIEPLRAFGMPTMSIGYLVPADTAMIWRGPMVQSAIEQLLREVIWGELDILVIDLPPGGCPAHALAAGAAGRRGDRLDPPGGDAQLTLSQRVPLAGAVIVSTPQEVALADVRKAINMFNKVHVRVLGIIENMSVFACPHCGEHTEIFGHGGAAATAAELGIDFLGEIPLIPVIRETSDAGQPIVAVDPESEAAHAYRKIAAAVLERLAPAEEGPRIVIQ